MKISWPTIFLFFAVAVAHLSTVTTEPTAVSKRILLLIFHTVCCYAQFTVMHDSSHRAIAPGIPFVNDMFGWLSQAWLGPTTNFCTFRYIHHMHHKYVNDPEKDPDTFAKSDGPGGKWLMPLRWMFIDIAYWKYYIPKVAPFIRTRPLREAFVVWIYHVITIGLVLLTMYTGHFHILWWNWILPSRLAKVLLAFAFDYLPHEGRRSTPQTDEYHTTHYLSLPPYLKTLGSIALFNHNYHIIHHLYPTIPYYDYVVGWIRHKDRLVNDLDVDIWRLFPYLGKEKI